ncbi:MAG: anti-sigma F factor [Firmicutes bacterium]|jgi:stage II sporulation protein AB (anti-sigma F factor)|nr:anti-sigma F factor [Bacillota bacterium]
MTDQVNRARVEFLSIPDNLGFARVAATSFAASLGFTLEELEDIKLAVSEAVSNCVVHAYPRDPGPVVMVLEVFNRGFRVEVRDEGVGIADIEAARAPGYSSDPERMGMGLTLIEALSDSFEISSSPGSGTVVTMSFTPEGS